MRDAGIAVWLLLGVVALGCAGPATETAEDDWPVWRGPRQDGSAAVARVLSSEAPRLELAWKRPLGAGFSSVSAREGTAVTLETDGEREHLVALDLASGDERWRASLGPTAKQTHPESPGGPLSTPLIHGDSVFAISSAGNLVAASLERGRVRWQLRLDERLGAQPPQFGFGTSPLVTDGTLIVMTGAGDGRSICGLDPHSGDERWCSGSDPLAYQSPLVADLGAEGRLILATDRRVTAFAPASMEPTWSVEHIVQVRDGYAQLVPLGRDRFFVHYVNYAAAYRLAGDAVEETWRSEDLAQSYGVPVAWDGRIYGFKGDRLVCLDAASGERLWLDDRLRGRGLLHLGDLLVVWDADGAVTLARVDDLGLHEVARIETGLEESYTAPSFAGGMLLVRDLHHVAAIRVVAS